jgi:uncharacterized protein YecE (DUF72 family)
MSNDAIHVGTSGWHYDHWRGPFYPEGMDSTDYLPYYAQRFQTVEINNTFYNLPEKETFVNWRQTAPEGFAFAVKANRYITHMKNLLDPGETVPPFLEATDELGGTLGPILFQLPPQWHLNAERLRSFLEFLPHGYRYAFELRHPSWFDERVYGLLEEHDAAFCIYEIGGRQSPRKVTTDLVYVRLHGPTERAYEGSYSRETLQEWAEACRGWTDEGREVYVYFDNDQAGYAAQNAAELREMV